MTVFRAQINRTRRGQRGRIGVCAALLFLGMSAGAGSALAQAPAAGQSAAADPRGALTRVWEFEIARFDDRPITVGTVALGVVLLVLGFFLSRLLSATVGRRILPKVGVDTGAAVAFQRVIFYVFLLLFTLLALNIVNVPLTVFTLVGGAIAIGVGFGAQNIVNNFISGWILLAERQVNIGDLIEVEGKLGYVRSIGARCTHVRGSDGIDLLIPNSLMLERTVVNWTMTDSDIRTTVRVGVVHGSPVDKVIELIRTVVNEHEKVLSQPKPVIIFEEIDSSALVFEVYFWVHTSAEMELRLVRSDIRYMIEKLFGAAGIVIARPQRDMHLDTSRPLEVRMASADAEARSRREAAADAGCSVAMLRDVAPLRSLSNNELETLARTARRREVMTGEAVVTQGDPGASLFVVSEGLLHVSVAHQGANRKVGRILPGHFFGEVSLLTGEPRSATVTAATHSVVHEIDRDMLAPILQARPEVVRRLSEALVERKTLTDEQLKGPTDTMQGMSRNLVAELRKRISAFFGLRD